MKTRNFQMGYVLPEETHKEVFFNENLGVLDAMLTATIVGFRDAVPPDTEKSSKFILTAGDKANHLCFTIDDEKDWQFLAPSRGMFFYCEEMANFIKFDGKSWAKAIFANMPESEVTHASIIESIPANTASAAAAASSAFSPDLDYSKENITEEPVEIFFEGASGDYEISKQMTYLYLGGKTKLILAGSKHIILDIILKQNSSKVFDVEFDAPILWKSGGKYVSSRSPNRFDQIRLIKLPETEHFIGEVIHSSTSY
jgi:hypothetical protein